MRIAIVRLGAMGDIVFCMACLQLIRRRLPDAQITWVADRKFADILDHHPDIELIKLTLKGPGGRYSLSGLLGDGRQLAATDRFDVAIDLHGMVKSAAIARLIGKTTCGFSRSAAKEAFATLFYSRSLQIPLETNTVRRYATLAAWSLGISFAEEELIEKEPYLYFAPEDEEISREYFSRAKKNIIFIPSSGWESRNYPEDKLATVANELGENILICHGTSAEYEKARYIAERSSCASILPRLNVNQLKAAISRADLVIGGDTGPTHIAWANNIPCVVIFGPTPAHRIYPGRYCRILKSSSPVIEHKLDKHDYSIREIPESDVIEAATDLLANSTHSGTHHE